MQWNADGSKNEPENQGIALVEVTANAVDHRVARNTRAHKRANGVVAHRVRAGGAQISDATLVDVRAPQHVVALVAHGVTLVARRACARKRADRVAAHGPRPAGGRAGGMHLLVRAQAVTGQITATARAARLVARVDVASDFLPRLTAPPLRLIHGAVI